MIYKGRLTQNAAYKNILMAEQLNYLPLASAPVTLRDSIYIFYIYIYIEVLHLAFVSLANTCGQHLVFEHEILISD